MSSMMETMTTTRKAMWRFRSSMGCYVPRGSFSLVGWKGKSVTLPILHWSLPRTFTNSGERFGDHIWF